MDLPLYRKISRAVAQAAGRPSRRPPSCRAPCHWPTPALSTAKLSASPSIPRQPQVTECGGISLTAAASGHNSHDVYDFFTPSRPFWSQTQQFIRFCDPCRAILNRENPVHFFPSISPRFSPQASPFLAEPIHLQRQNPIDISLFLAKTHLFELQRHIHQPIRDHSRCQRHLRPGIQRATGPRPTRSSAQPAPPTCKTHATIAPPTCNLLRPCARHR